MNHSACYVSILRPNKEFLFRNTVACELLIHIASPSWQGSGEWVATGVPNKLHPTIIYLVVEPTHLKFMLVKLGIFLNFRGENETYLKPPPSYIYGSVSRVANPPPPMVWVQNLRFGYIFMEPAKTHGIYNVLTSSASETVVFAAFCNTTLYTTTLIVLLLLLLLLQLQQQQQQQQQLLLLLRLRKNPQSKSPPPPLPQGGAGVIF